MPYCGKSQTMRKRKRKRKAAAKKMMIRTKVTQSEHRTCLDLRYLT
jgi:hypothetical protein